MKTVVKTVGGQAVGILLYALMVLFTSVLLMTSPYIGIGMYLLTPLAILFFISIYTILIIEDLVEEEAYNLHIEEYTKKVVINVIISYVIGLVVQTILQTKTGILSYDPIEVSVFVMYLAYIIPYSIVGLITYEDTFDKLGLSKDVLKGYIAVLMVLLMSIFIITSFTKVAFILSGVLVGVTFGLTYLVHMLHNKGQKDLTKGDDLEYTGNEKE